MADASDCSTHSLWRWRESRPSRDRPGRFAIQWLTPALPRTCWRHEKRGSCLSDGQALRLDVNFLEHQFLRTWEARHELGIHLGLQNACMIWNMLGKEEAPWGKRVEIWCCSYCPALILWLTAISWPVSPSSSYVFSKESPKTPPKCVISQL